MCLVHRQQVTKPAAIFLAFLLPWQRCSTGCTCLRRFFYTGIRFVIRRPPFDPTRVTAEPPLFPCSPFCLKLFPAVGTDRFCLFSCLPSFHDFTSMIFDPALVTAKPPPPSPFSTLLHDISTAWADIYWHIIMPLGVMIFVPTCVTAKFLPRDMTRWLKRLPAVQALQNSLFLTHDFSAPCLFTPILPQGERSSSILRLRMQADPFCHEGDSNPPPLPAFPQAPCGLPNVSADHRGFFHPLPRQPFGAYASFVRHSLLVLVIAFLLLSGYTYAILFIRGAKPVMDLKYELTEHPAIRHTVDGGGPPYIHKGKQTAAFQGTPFFQAFSADTFHEEKENAA